MKLRIRFRDKREVVQLPDISTNGYSVRQLTQIVEDTFNLESDEFQLSLNGTDPISHTSDDTALSDLGIVSGDLINILSTRPISDEAPRNYPQPSTVSGHVSVTVSTSHSASEQMDITEEQSLCQQESNASATPTQMDSEDIEKHLKEAGLMGLEDGAGLADPEVNHYLQAPMLCREATSSQVPLVLSQTYSAANVVHTNEAICVVLHVLMLEIGLRTKVSEDAPSSSSSPDSAHSSTCLPAGWRGTGVFRLHYCLPGLAQAACTLTVVPLGPLLIIYGSLDGSPVCQLKVNPGEFIKALNTEAENTYQNLDRLSRLFKDKIGHPMLNSLRQDAGLPCSSGFEGLLTELKVLILQNLDARSLVRLSQTCKDLHRTIRDSVLWRRLYLRDFGSKAPMTNKSPVLKFSDRYVRSKRSDMNLAQDWYKLYKDMYVLRKRMREQFRHMTPVVPPFINRPNPLYPFAPYQPGIIGGDYDINPLFSVDPDSFDFSPSSSLLPNPRFDPVGPLPDHRFHLGRGRASRDRGFRPRFHTGGSFLKMF